MNKVDALVVPYYPHDVWTKAESDFSAHFEQVTQTDDLLSLNSVPGTIATMRRFELGVNSMHEVIANSEDGFEDVRVRAIIEQMIPRVWQSDESFEKFFRVVWSAHPRGERLARVLYVPATYRTPGTELLNAPIDEVKRIHRTVAKAVHPDRTPLFVDSNPMLRDKMFAMACATNITWSTLQNILRKEDSL